MGVSQISPAALLAVGIPERYCSCAASVAASIPIASAFSATKASAAALAVAMRC